MMKKITMFNYFSATSVAILCYLLISRQDWRRIENLSITKMMGFSPEGDYILSEGISSTNDSNVTARELEEYMWEESAFHDLPQNVQRYLHRAFTFTGEKETVWEDTIQMLRSLEVEEEGTLLLNGKWWVPYTAKQQFAANALHPGYIHDIQISIPSPVPFFSDLKIHVRDNFFNGKPSKDARVMNFIPVLDKDLLSTSESGALLNWLSASPLFPSSLLPHETDGVHWGKEKLQTVPGRNSSPHSSCAKISIPSGLPLEAEFGFDNYGLVTSIFAYAQKVSDDGTISTLPWECHLSDYELKGHGMMVPTKFNYGWWENGKFRPYLHTTYSNFNYTYF